MKKIIFFILGIVLISSCTEKDTVKTVDVASIILNKTEATMILGETDILSTIVLPKNATNQTLTWSTSDANIVRVDDKGEISALAEGVVDIKVISANKVEAICKVTVTLDTDRVASIHLDQEVLEIYTRSAVTLVATVLPETAEDREFTWATSDEAIAKVTDGFVYGVKPGVANITVTTRDGNKVATCVVTITDEVFPVESLTLDQSEFTTCINNKVILNYTVLPAKATDKTINWTSSDETVATVVDGVISTKKEGSATITATTTSNAKTATCEVTVSGEQFISIPVLSEPESVDVDMPYLTINLAWTPSVALDGGAIKYDIYMGMAEDSMRKVVSDLETPECGAYLDYKIDYFWKVVAKDSKNGIISSAVGTYTTPSLGLIPMTMVFPSTFVMGTTRFPNYEEGGIQYPDETPVHNVTISSPIDIGIYEITQAQWKAVMGIDNNPSYYKGNNLPVQGISWYWAVEYIKALNIMTNQAYRLPTEAEWEYCATGGPNHKTFYYAGSDNIDDVSWYEGNSGYKPHPVGSKAPNSCGVYDMSGNVSEWCLDWMHKYTADDVTDPTGPDEGEMKIQRGGSGQTYNNFTRVTSRNYDKPEYGSSSSAGFRVVHRW